MGAGAGRDAHRGHRRRRGDVRTCVVGPQPWRVGPGVSVMRPAEHSVAVSEQTGAEVRATAADAARQARGVLAALGDPDDGLTATAAMRNRIEGAAVALETVASGDPGGDPVVLPIG